MALADFPPNPFTGQPFSFQTKRIVVLTILVWAGIALSRVLSTMAIFNVDSKFILRISTWLAFGLLYSFIQVLDKNNGIG